MAKYITGAAWYDDIEISQVYNRLYVGGLIQGSNLGLSNPYGIQAVLDVHTEATWEIAAGVEYKEAKDIVYAHIPFPDGEEIPAEKFWACMRYLSEQYQQGRTILIHCAAGVSRSVTIAISFLVFAHIMDWPEAETEVRQRRSIANPNVRILTSAKKLLRIWPYDGSMTR
jgi:protein-tyrosine phosphatase